MGLQQFEHRLERLVEGTFARLFRSGLQPVEVGRKLIREMDLTRTAGIRGPMAPNIFEVTLSLTDYDRFSPFEDELVEELQEAAREHARQEGYRLLGEPVVNIAVSEEYPAGVFAVEASYSEEHHVEQSEPVSRVQPRGILILPNGNQVALGNRHVIIGRLATCDVVIPDQNVSRHHAEILWQAGVPYIADLASTNGTQVNGLPITTQELHSGDRIRVGSTVLLFKIA